MNPIRGDLARVRSCMMILFCLLFSSCTKHFSSSHKNGTKRSLINPSDGCYLDTIIQQEAMLVDIPIPLYDHRIVPVIHDDIEHDTLIFGYKSPLNSDQAISFFMTQMERYGWRHMITFDGHESLLQFESPDRYCTVVIKKPDHCISGSVIFIYIKRASTNARPFYRFGGDE